MPRSIEQPLIVRDAMLEDLDDVALLIKDAYQEYQSNFPPEVWERYAMEIVDVRSRLDTAELIVAEHAGELVGSVTFYPTASPSD